MTRAEAARVLIASGLSAAKAHEIALDYERGDKYAAAFVQIAANNHPPAPGLLADVTA
ncbi:MAG: hypothetical protein INH43_12585 [Acidobacteriaceae bacterium]|nr:hypothetical protein [Acidobacteriaceae bacterium]